MHEFFLSAYYTIIFFCIALATEAFIEIIKESDISLALIHAKIIPRYNQNPTTFNWVLFKWITCGQCMSVIYSIPGAVFMSTLVPWYYLPFSFFAFLFALQRTANWLNTSYKLLARGRVTAIELVSPLVTIGSEMAEYNPEALLSQAKEREFRRGTEQRVIINSVQDIIRMIKLLKDKKPGSGRVVSVNIGKSEFHVNTSTDHPPYMQIIQDAFVGVNQDESPAPVIEINEGERLVPLNIGSNHAIDGFITKCTGGVRDGNRIKWSLSEGDYFYDPVTDKLTMTDRVDHT